MNASADAIHKLTIALHELAQARYACEAKIPAKAEGGLFAIAQDLCADAEYHQVEYAIRDIDQIARRLSVTARHLQSVARLLPEIQT